MTLDWPDRLFFLVLAIPLLFIAITPVYPTVDGAAHLYNAEIIKELLFNSTGPYHQSYQFNAVIVPNWFGHVVLGCLLLFLPVLWAQKVFLLLMVLAMALIFRKLVKTLAPENKWLSVLILPFIFSSFFYLGLYNQQWSFVIFLSFLHWMVKNEYQHRSSIRYYIGILMYSLLLWSCSIMTYGIMLVFLAVHFLVKWIKESQTVKDVIVKAMLTFLMVVPTLLLTYLFVTSVKMESEEPVFGLWEKAVMVFNLRPLITFSYYGELVFMIGLAFVLQLMLVVGFIRGPVVKEKSFFISLVWMSAVCLIAGVFIPNESGAGMLTYRFLMLGYLFVLVLIVSLKYHVKLLVVVFVVVGLLFIGLTFKRHNGRIRTHANSAAAFYECGNYIKTGGLVLPVQVGNSWLSGHLSNYCAMRNKAIVLTNYEACLPWFPVQWKGKCSSLQTIITDKNKKVKLEKTVLNEADYLLIHGLTGGSNEADSLLKVNGVKEILVPRWHSADDKIYLFEIIKRSF